MLARLAEGKECIAVTGTSGKTTVTGMVGFVLEQLGGDPTVVNGGVVANWESEDRIGNVRVGHSSRWVLEADESDRSLLRFHPDWAIITNVSADHCPEAEARELFRTFAAQVRRGVLGPEGAVHLDARLSADGARFRYGGQDFCVPLLGRHNVENALWAILLCERLGHPLSGVADALARFRGIRRRLDVIGTANGVTVIDDYAHNPAKIRAAWEAVAPHYERVLAVWRPHGYGPLSKMLSDLKGLFREMGRGCGGLTLLPVYYAGGTAQAAVTSEMLVNDLRGEGVPIELAQDYDDLVERIGSRAKPGDVVLSMGARDPNLPAVAARMVRAIAARPGKAQE
jgi:UDP-N-acetylmuramate--alanine ligase